MRLALVECNTNNNSSKGVKIVKDEENVALADKGKVKKGPSEGQGSKGGDEKKKYLSKIKCFRHGEFDHYNTHYSQRMKDKTEKQEHTTTSAEINELTSRLEEFALITFIPLDGRGA